MKTKANDPINPLTEIIEKNGLQTVVEFNGLTKREYFAAMAMQGLLASAKDIIYPIIRVAKDAVDYADALIDELNKDE